LAVLRASESEFGPRWITFLDPPTRADGLKIVALNRKDWLSLTEWLGLGLKGLICKSTNNYTT
jgi:hypothetical protein